MNTKDLIEPPTQPMEMEPIRLADSQWMNIVNHDHAYENYSTEDAVHLAIRLTEARMAKNAAATITRLISERDTWKGTAKAAQRHRGAAEAERDAFKRSEAAASKASHEFETQYNALLLQTEVLRDAIGPFAEYDDTYPPGTVPSNWAAKALSATEHNCNSTEE